ncbi:HlyD family secretion protein [Rubripirellula tenax]|uniref:HlyD family secretion protein n=2 Tax=Rubripirellula tenax TaxID=2528015 RepID=A0A5C6FJS0_9BACT|nr:HlyD family secretion protein [Rubripirellula tenax]
MIAELLHSVGNLTRAIWVGYAEGSSDVVSVRSEYNALASQNLGLSHASVTPTIGKALKDGTQKADFADPLTVLCVPIGTSPGQAIALAMELPSRNVEPFLLVAQLASACVTRFDERSSLRAIDQQADNSAAIAELMVELASSSDMKDASLVAANRIADHLDASFVAIGHCRPFPWSMDSISDNASMTAVPRVRIEAISSVSDVGRDGEVTRLMVEAMSESLVRFQSLGETETRYRRDDVESGLMQLAHRQLAASIALPRIDTYPLITAKGIVIGAWMVIRDGNSSDDTSQDRFASSVGGYLSEALAMSRRAGESPLARWGNRVTATTRSRVRAIALGAVVAGAVMMVPVPHRVDCSTVLSAMSQRFATAPHSGILKQAFVRPGDAVIAGQQIAEMDGVELELRRAELIAHRQRASKQVDVQRTLRLPAETQIAKLEVDQLDAQIDLVEHQLAHLSITSDVDGVVLQGDWHDARGAMIREGDVLMQIAPLDRLRAEIEIPERELPYVRIDQSIRLTLDGQPLESIDASIKCIRPMSEIRDGQNIFLAEVELENEAKLLRPGMRGRTKVDAGQKSLGWVMFHHACESLYRSIR